MSNIDQITSFCKRKGFIYPGSEIYGGFANSYTYGPYGIELKNNIKQFWWKTFVHQREDVVGIDGDIILNPKVWYASGHTVNFNDQLIDCKSCKARLRADHLIEDQLKQDCEGLPEVEVTKLIKDNNIKCPKCGERNFTEVRKFNLMFQTQMDKTVEDSFAYLRPETAQAIFIEFKNIVDSMRVKLPFGIAQIGKAFRNEITPGNFIFRRLEFEQMEIEYFFELSEKEEDRWQVLFVQWQTAMKQWCVDIGLSIEKCHDLEHAPEKLSHYSKRTVDIEYDFPFGRKELYGLAYRTNFDLSQHEKHSGKSLQYRDQQTNKVFIPHVIEPTFGVDRTVLAIICDAYKEEILEDGSTRLVLKFVPKMAPVKVAVLPLQKKDELIEKAKNILQKLQILGLIEFDITGSIGKRYRRQDEIGTPVCVTVDYESLDDQAVTIRDRDTMKQKRVPINNLLSVIQEKYEF